MIDEEQIKKYLSEIFFLSGLEDFFLFLGDYFFFCIRKFIAEHFNPIMMSSYTGDLSFK